MTDDRPQALRDLPPEFLTLALALHEFSDARYHWGSRVSTKFAPSHFAVADAAGTAARTVHRMPADASAREAVDRVMATARLGFRSGVLDNLIAADVAVRKLLWTMPIEQVTPKAKAKAKATTA